MTHVYLLYSCAYNETQQKLVAAFDSYDKALAFLTEKMGIDKHNWYNADIKTLKVM